MPNSPSAVRKRRARTGAGTAAILAFLVPLAAQDVRDTVVLRDGTSVRGRVVTPFDPHEILVLQDGSRVRVPREKVAEIRTITLDVATLLQERRDARQNVRFHWMLAEWAAAHELPALARLQALQTVLLDPAHEAAHEFLGHRHHGTRGWLWPVGSRWLTFDQVEQHHSEWGRALELSSEHFTIRTDAGHRTAIDTLIDLERLYVFLLAEFGEPLQLREAIQPMAISVRGRADDFSRRGNEAIPYYEPHPFGDRGWTFLVAPNERPLDLFAVGTQMVLYRCLANDAAVSDPFGRLCAWAELGFSHHVQSRLHGPPGAAVAGPPALDVLELDLARNARPYRLPNLLHLTLRDHFYGGFGGSSLVHWASVEAFTQFLMDPGVDRRRPARFLEYLRLALREGKGDSSSAFDAAIGLEIEALEAEFDAWLGQHGAPRRG